jgi:hypothetical protein
MRVHEHGAGSMGGAIGISRVDLNDAVLACLKQNRARLSKICAKVLTDNGQ